MRVVRGLSAKSRRPVPASFWTPLRRHGFGAISHRILPCPAGAVSAAEHAIADLEAVADDAAVAMAALWGEGVDRALEGIEEVGFAAQRDLERLVVFVSANF